MFTFKIRSADLLSFSPFFVFGNFVYTTNLLSICRIFMYYVLKKSFISVKQEKLFGAQEIQRFNRDADETITWITEKDVLISSEYGKDLASVQTLQRKHETLERDLAALEDKVRALTAEAERLQTIHSEHSQDIQSKHEEIKSCWETLISKAKEHRQKLDESYFLHRFLSDYRDLTSWINDTKSFIAQGKF